MDKGYVGAHRDGFRAIIPKRKPPGGVLTRQDLQRNLKISSDRVIVEVFLVGQLLNLVFYQENSRGKSPDLIQSLMFVFHSQIIILVCIRFVGKTKIIIIEF